MLTRKNANSVPMFTSSASSDNGMKAAIAAARIPNVSVIRTGVLRFESFAKPRGSSPSRHMENMIRDCP